MADYKETGVVFMRERVSRAGPAIERLFLQQLTYIQAIHRVFDWSEKRWPVITYMECIGL